MALQKRKIYIILISIFIYFILNYFYHNMFLKKDVSYIYMLNSSLSRGTQIAETDLVKLNIDNKYLTNFKDYIKEEDVLNISELVLNNDYKEGQLLLKSMFLKKEEYLKAQDGKQILSIKVSDSTENVAYQVQKGSYVNIYYTGKLAQVQNLANIGLSSNIVNEGKDGYLTMLVFENVKVEDVFDKSGNKLNESEVASKNLKLNNDNNLVDTILVQADTKKIMEIDNLKNYGKFSLSILK